MLVILDIWLIHVTDILKGSSDMINYDKIQNLNLVDSVLFAVQDLALPQEIGNQVVYVEKPWMYCLHPRIWRFHSTPMAIGSLLGMLGIEALDEPILLLSRS